MSETLHPLSLPLWGSRLIEASAGTGKTWTIAALYLRLVLGHGGENGFVRPLRPAEILVMTFTRAATRELSDRIRARLLQAAQAFALTTNRKMPCWPTCVRLTRLAPHAPTPRGCWTPPRKAWTTRPCTP